MISPSYTPERNFNQSSAFETKEIHGLQFPWKLHSILNDPEFSAIATWMPNGKSFRILCKDRFANEIMPIFFNSRSYKSFQRSLNLWGFRIFLKGPQRGECYHPFFHRGNSGLCGNMKRVKLLGKSTKSEKNIDTKKIRELDAKPLHSGPSIALKGATQRDQKTDPTSSSVESMILGMESSRRDRCKGVVSQNLLPASPPATQPHRCGFNIHSNNIDNISPFLLQAAGEIILEQHQAEIHRQLLQAWMLGSHSFMTRNLSCIHHVVINTMNNGGNQKLCPMEPSRIL